MAISKAVWIGLLQFRSKNPNPNPKAPKYTSSKFKLKEPIPAGTYDVAFFDWGEETDNGIPKVVIKIDNPYVPIGRSFKESEFKDQPQKKEELKAGPDDDIPF